MRENSYFNYGKNVKEVRKNRGFTQFQMATFLKISTATIKDIENKNHIPNVEILKSIKKLFPELKNTIEELIIFKNKDETKLPREKRKASKTLTISEIEGEILKKIEELEKVKTLINMKQIEYNTLERTSGVRSRVAWACIDIQKHVSSKIIEVMSIYNMANSSNKKECHPAMKQLSFHLESFSKQITKIIKEESEEIDYE